MNKTEEFNILTIGLILCQAGLLKPVFEQHKF